jgi:hypothetical protein
MRLIHLQAIDDAKKMPQGAQPQNMSAMPYGDQQAIGGYGQPLLLQGEGETKFV